MLYRFEPFRSTSSKRLKYKNKYWSTTFDQLVASLFPHQAPTTPQAWLEDLDISARDDLPVTWETLPIYQHLSAYEAEFGPYDLSKPVHRGHLFEALKKPKGPAYVAEAYVSLLTYQLFGSSALLVTTSPWKTQHLREHIAQLKDVDKISELAQFTMRRLDATFDTFENDGFAAFPLAPVVTNEMVDPWAFGSTGLILSLLKNQGLIAGAHITGLSSVISPTDIIFIERARITSNQMSVFDFDRLMSTTFNPQYKLMKNELADHNMWGDEDKSALPQHNPLVAQSFAYSRKLPSSKAIKAIKTTDQLHADVAKAYAKTTGSLTSTGSPRISGVSSTFSVQSRNDPSDPNIPGLKASIIRDRDIYLWVDVSPSVSYEESVASLKITYDVLRHMKVNQAHVAFFADEVSEVISISIAGSDGLNRFLTQVEDMWVRSYGTRIDKVMDVIRASPTYSQAFNLIVTDFGFSFTAAQPFNPNIFFAPVDGNHQGILKALNREFMPSLAHYAPAYAQQVLGLVS